MILLDSEKILNSEKISSVKSGEYHYNLKFADLFFRFLDVFFFIILIITLLLPMVIISLLIKLEDGGSVFFVQNRLGRNGKSFKIIKFRTMVVGAESKGAKLRVEKGDNRITNIGKILRNYHLDEFPQLFNVIKGDMSFVGPRPTLLFHKDYYEDWEMNRLKIRPGITGLSQVVGANSLDWDKRIVIDIFYVVNRSVSFYFLILFLTIFRAIRKKGVYSTEGDVKGWNREIPQKYK